MGLLDYFGLGNTGIGDSLGITDENRGGVSRGLLNFAAAVGKPNGGAGIGSSIANGLLGYAKGPQDFEDDQFNKMYKQAGVQKSLSEAEINRLKIGAYKQWAGADPSKPQPVLLGAPPKMSTPWINPDTNELSMPGQGMGGGMGDPSQMQFNQQQQPMQLMQGGANNPYASNFTAPTAGDSGSAVGQDVAGNNAQNDGGLPSYRQLVAMNFLDPTLAKNIFDIKQAKIKGVEQDEGKYYIDENGNVTYNPHLDKGMLYDRSTKQAMPIQGYAEGMARMAGMKAGAEKAAEFPTLMAQKAADNQQVHEFKEVMGPDGKPTIVGINRAGQPVPTGLSPVPKDTNKAPNEGQANALSFGARMQGAARTLGGLEDKVSPWNLDLYATELPWGIGREYLAVKDPDAQKYAQAMDDWIGAHLRKDSGAAIGQDEMQRERRTYFPMKGDTPELAKQKAAARALAERAIMAQSGPAASMADGILNPGQAGQQPQAQGVPIAGGNTNQGQPPQATNPQVEAMVRAGLAEAKAQGLSIDEGQLRRHLMQASGG